MSRDISVFAKPAFLLRSLFVATALASVVACSFEEQPDTEKGASSALHKKGSHSAVDSGVGDDDGGTYGVDSGVGVNDGGTDPEPARCGQGRR